MRKFYRWYAKKLLNNQKKVLIISVVVIAVALGSLTQVESASMDNEDMTPEDSQAQQDIEFVSNEFQIDGSTVTVLIQLDPDTNQTRINDIRDPEALNTAGNLASELQRHPNVQSTSSPTQHLEDPSTLSESREQIRETDQETFQLQSTSKQIEQIQKNVQELETGLEEVETGIEDSESSIRELEENLDNLNNELLDIATSDDSEDLDSIKNDLEEISQNNEALDDQLYNIYIQRIDNSTYENSENSVLVLAETIQNIGLDDSDVNSEVWNNDTLAGNVFESSSHISQNFEALESLEDDLSDLESDLDDLDEGLMELESGYTDVGDGLFLVREGLNETDEGISEIDSGLSGVDEGLGGVLQFRETFTDEPETDLDSNEGFVSDSYFSDDYSLMIVQVQLTEVDSEDQEEVVRELSNIVDSVDSPSDVSVGLTGDPVIFDELEDEIAPTIARTGTLSIVVIGSLLILFFMSFRYGITAFLTVLIAEVLTFGYMGFRGIPVTTEMAGMVTMILAFGDDFGIQVVNRFKQELREKDPEKALEDTLVNVMVPMTMTTAGILIGFRAFTLGNLDFLATLADVLTLGVICCFITALTIIPVLLLQGEKYLSEDKT